MSKRSHSFGGGKKSLTASGQENVPASWLPRRSPIAHFLMLALGTGITTTAAAQVSVNDISVTGRTSTVVTTHDSVTDITTSTVKGSNAFNSFNNFVIGSGNTVNLHLPTENSVQVRNLINLVGNKAEIHGTLSSLYADGKIGGNVFFATPKGFVVGASGVVNVGKLAVSTPSSAFMDQIIDAQGTINADALATLLDGKAPNAEDGFITIQGKVNALESIRLQSHSVNIDDGATLTAGHAASAAIALNLNDASMATGLVADSAGTIQIVADTTRIDGTLIADRHDFDEGGGILITASESVTIGTSGSVRSIADSSNASGAADVAISAIRDVMVGAGTADARAVVDIAGKVSGGNVTITAQAKATAKYDGDAADADFVSDATKLADMLEDVADLAQGELELGLVQAKADAKVVVRETAELDASHDLTLQAKAERSATTPAIEAKGENEEDAFVIGAVLGSVSGTTSVEVLGGATLTAGGDVTAKAESINQVDIEATSTTADEESYLAATLAYGHAEVDTRAKIAAGADIKAANVRISARNDNEFSVKSSAKAVGEAVIGAAVAITDFKTTADAELVASLAEGNVRGNLLVDAQSYTSQNFVKATTDTGAKDGGSATKKIQAAAGKIDDFINKKQEKAQGKADKAAGETEGSPVKLASALALSSSQHDAKARIADNAAVSVAGNVAVVAKVRDEGIRNIATSNVEAQKEQKGDGKVTGSAAIAIGSYAHNAEALIGKDVKIDAERIGVDATVELPLTITWWKWDAADGLIDNLKTLIDGKTNTELGVPEQVLTTYANATGTSEGLGFAGAISYFEADNNARAWVDDNAELSSRATPVTAEAARWETELSDDFKIDWDDVISVRALSQAESINVAGNFKLTGLATSGGKDAASVGGAFNWVNYGNTAQAGIGAGAKIDTQGLAVKANSKDWVLAISPTSGGGTSIAGSAILALTQIDNVTHASISHDANIRAKRLELDALQEFSVLSIAGAFVKSEAVAGAAGLAFNDVRADTRAFIGDNRDVDEDDRQMAGSGSVATDALLVEATTDGQVVSLAVAGAVASSADPKPEPEPDPDKKPGFIEKKKEQLQGKLQNLQTKAQEKLDQLPLVGALAGSLSKKEGEQDNAPLPQETQTKPKVGLSAAGSVTGTISQLDTQAYVDGVTIGAYTADSTVDTIVRAKNDTDLIGAAGAAAFTKANKSSVEYSAAVAGAAAFNVLLNDTYAGLRGAALNDAGNVSVQALSAGDSIAIGIAPAINASKGDSSASVAGSASLSWIANQTVAEIDDSTIYGVGTGGLDVTAYDRSRTINGGGSVNAGGKYGLGVALSVAHVGNTAAAAIKGGAISGFGAVDVSALSSSRLISAAATGGGSKDGSHLVGSFVFNDVANTMYAGISDSAQVTTSGDVRVLATGTSGEAALDAELGARRDLAEYTLDRGDAPAPDGDDDLIDDARFGEDSGGELIVGVAGAVGAGDNAAGLSFVGNVVRNNYQAVIEEANVVSDALVSVKAQDSAQIIGVAAGVAVGKKTFAGMGSGVANVVTTNVNARVGAADKSRTSITANGLDVMARDAAELWAGAGSVAASKGKAAVGASVAFNATIDVDAVNFDADAFDSDKRDGADRRGTAAVIENATINLDGGMLKVDAASESAIRAIAVAGTGSTEAAIGGSLTFNIIDDAVASRIEGSTIDASGASVLVHDQASIWSLAGNVAGSSGKAAIGAAFAVNTIASSSEAAVADSDLTIGGDATVAADTGSEIYSIAVAGGGAQGVAAGISSTVNTIAKSTAATVADSTITDGAGSGSLLVRASDRAADGSNGSTIWSLAGNVQGAGKAAVGLAASVNNIVNDLTAEVYGSTVTLDGAVAIAADSGAEIRSAAVAGGGAGKAAVMGSASTNTITNDTRAELNGGSITAGSLDVAATERSDDARTSIWSLAGAVSGAGTAAVGAAVAVNTVTNTLEAKVDGGTHTVSGDTHVTADSGTEIYTGAVAGGGAGTAAIGGAIAVNTIANTAAATIDGATLTDGSGSDGALLVRASDRLADGSNGTEIIAAAGSAQGAGTAAVGGAASTNTIVNTIAADVRASTVDIGGDVDVLADSAADIKSIAIAGGGAGTAAVTGSASVNTIVNTTRARVMGGEIEAANLSVTARERSGDFAHRTTIWSLAGNVSGAGTAAIGGAAAVNTIANDLIATVDGTAVDVGSGDVNIASEAGSEIKSAAAAGAGAGTVAATGATTINTIANHALASVVGNAQITADTLTVAARDIGKDGGAGSSIQSLAGNVNGAGTASVGMASAVNNIANSVEAGIADSTLTIADATTVEAKEKAKIETLAADGGGAGTAAVGGSATVNTIANTTRAGISNTSNAGNGNDTRISASDTSSIDSIAGAVRIGGQVGVGAAASINRIANTVDAYVSGNKSGNAYQAKNVVLDAASDAAIRTIAVGVAAGGMAGVAGSVATNILDTKVTSRIDSGALVRADNNVGVLAENSDKIEVAAGAAGIGGTNAGVALSTVVNVVDSQTKAFISDAATDVTALGKDASDTLTVKTGELVAVPDIGETPDAESFAWYGLQGKTRQASGVTVNAFSTQQVGSISASVGATLPNPKGSGAVGATAGVNVLAGATEAYIDGAQINKNNVGAGSGQDIDITAGSHSYSTSFVAGASVSGDVAMGGAIGTATVSRATRAYAKNADLTAADSIAVSAQSGQGVRIIGASAGGAIAGGAGTGLVGIISGMTEAYLDNATVRSIDLDVNAASRSGLNLMGGALAIGGGAAGGALSVAISDQTTRAFMRDGQADVSGKVAVQADADTRFWNLSVSGAAGLVAGLAGMASVNVVSNTTEAYLDGATIGGSGKKADAVTVAATDDVEVRSYGGALGVSLAPGAGIGAAANVTVVQSRVAAEVVDSAVYADNALRVLATSDVDAEHVTASAGLSTAFGAAGSASLILLGNGSSGEAMSELNQEGDGLLQRVFDLTSGEKVSETEGLDDDQKSALDNRDAQDSRTELANLDADRANRLGTTQLSLSGGSIGELKAVNDRSTYDTSKHFGSSADADVTRAAITGGTIEAGAVSVEATDYSRTSNISGAAGIGASGLGVGGGVAITRVYNDVQAVIAANSLSSGNVTVAAKALNGSGDAAHALAFAGGAGPVGLGAAWADAYVENAVIAIVDGGVGSSGKVAVTAQDDSRVYAESIGAAAGAGAAGISVAMAEKSSTVGAGVDGMLSQAGSLDVIASSAGRVASRATGAAGGLAFAGTGAGADAFDRSKVMARIADGARIDVSGTSLIEATATPQTSAEALGVAVSAGVGVGASVAKAKAETEVEASIGAGAEVTSGNLSVLARNLTPTNSRTAFAKATGASGGFLWGANATVADASSNTDVHAFVDAGAVVTVPGTVAVGASNFSKQRAEALGIAAGIVAVGANLASASSNAVSDAHFDGRLSSETEQLSVSAIGEDDNHAQAIAGSGGVVAGHAAVADTVSNSRTTAELQRAGSNQLLKAGMIVVDATHTTRFNGEVDSVQAAVVGMSGAITRHRVNTDTDAIIGTGAKLDTQDLVVKATDIIRKDWLSDYNIRAAGGGVASGAAADGDIRVTQSTDAIIGEHAVINVTGRRADAHQFEVAALNDFKIYDKSKLDTGGVIAVAAAANRIDVNSHAKVSIGRNATLDSVGGINLYGHTYGRVEANANAKTYGVAGAAQGDSQALITASQTIDVETGASLRADGEIRLGAGRKPDGTANNIYATALTDTWNKTAFPISILSATGRVDETATINLAEGSKLRGVTDIVLLAEKGQIGGSGRYTGMDLYRKAMQEAANAIGKLVGAGESSWELSGGTSTTRGGSNLRLDGLAESGIQNKQFLTIGWDAEREEHFIERVSDEGITYRVGEETLASGLQARLEALYASRDEYAGNNEAVTAYNLEIQRLEQQLRELNNATGNDPALPRDVVIQIIDVAPILAAAGNIRIEGDNLAGSGQLISPGDAQIEVINKTPYFLRLDDLLIPDEAGGFIRYNGSIVRDNASINAINAEGSAAFSQIITGENSPEPSILVKNTFDPNAVGVDSLGMPAPDIYLNGNIRNMQGTVTVQSVAGSVIADGLINAKTINLSAGRDFVLGYVDAFRHIGASPEGLWSDITRKLETGEYWISGDKVVKMGQVWNEALKMYLPGVVEVTTTAPRDSSGALIAGSNVYISGRYLNINGTIQSGIPDWDLDIGNLDGKIDAANAAYQQRLAKGNADPYIELVNWSQGNDPKQSRKVTAWWNAQEQRIELDGIQVEGGYMELFGEIISTGGGKLNVLDGYGQITIDNKSGKDLVLRNLDVGHGVEGTIKITDLGKQNGSGKPLTTLYKRVGSDIQVWDNGTVDAYGNPTRLVQSHRDTRSLSAANGYKPTAGQRYYWLTGEAKTDHEKFHEERTVDQAFGIPLDWLIPAGYAYDNPQWRWSNDGKSLAEGQYLKNAGGNQHSGYQFRKDTHVMSDWEYGEWVRWDKCTKSGWIFGCFQRRYYAEQERWRGTKDVFTHSVAADKGIAINFIGYDQGLIDVKSNAGVLLSGLLHNPDGTINLQGSYIEQLSGNALIIGKDVNLSADYGIGTQHASGSQAGLRTDIGGVLTAATGSGDIHLTDISGDLRVNRAVTGNGDVDLGAQNSLVMVGSGASNVIRGRNITLTAKNGGIGSSAAAVNLDTGSSQDGLLNAVAGGDIYLKEASGDLWLESVRAGGDVYIEVLDGSIIDGNRNEARDSRTEAQLLALWDNMALVGDEADAAAEQGLLAYAQSKENEYQQYWRMRNARQDADGNWIADAYDAGYSFTFGVEEAALLKAQGKLSDADIRQMESDRTTAYHSLHESFGGTGFDPDFRYVVDATEIAAIKEGSAWELHQLKYSVSKGAFSGNTANTDPRVEEPNVEGRNITLIANKGSIGSTLADDIVIDISGGISGLTDAQRLALASAEIDDVSFDGDIITIVQRDDVDVHARGSITAMARDQIFLGGEQDINVSHIQSPVIRIKGGQSIIDSQVGTPSIIGAEVILEAGNGAIGSAGNPLDLNVSGKLTARAQQAIDIVQHGGDLTVDRLFSNGLASLNVLGGDLRQFSSEGVTLNAGSLNLITSGNVGSAGNAVSVQHGLAGNLMASTGGDLFITGPSSLLTLGDSQIGGQAQVHSAGRLFVDGDVQTLGEGAYTATGDISLADGAKLVSAAGIAIAASDVGMGEDSTIEAEDDVSITATGDVMVAQITARRASGDAIDIAAGGRILSDGGSDLVATGADANVLLRAGQNIGSGAQALSVDAANLDAIAANGDIDLHLLADTHASRILTDDGAISIVADGNLGYGTIRGTDDIGLAVAGEASGATLQSTTGSIDVRAGSADLTVVDASGEVAVDTTGAQTLGTVTTGGDQTLTAGGLLAAGTLNVGGALNVGAGSADIGTADVIATAVLATSGNQVIGSLTTGGDQVLNAGGDIAFTNLVSGNDLTGTATGAIRGGSATVAGRLTFNAGNLDVDALTATSGPMTLDVTGDATYATLSGGANLVTTVGGHLQGQDADFVGTVTIGANSADLGHVQTGADAQIATTSDLSIDEVIASTTLEVSAGDDATIGTATSNDDQTLHAGGLLTANTLTSRAGAIVIGDAAAQTGSAYITTANAATTFTTHTSGDQRLGAVVSGGDQALNAGGTVTAGILEGAANLDIVAGTLVLDQATFEGDATVHTEGDQQIGTLDTEGSIALTTQAGNGGDIVFGHLEAGAPETVGATEERLTASSITVEADGDLRRLTAATGDAMAEGMLSMKAYTFDVGTLKSAGADVALEATVDVMADLAHAKRDLRITAGNDMRIGEVNYGNELSLFAGRNLWAKVGGDIKFAVAEVGGNADLSSGGEIAFDRLKAGGHVNLDAAGNVTIDDHVEAGESISVTSGGDAIIGVLTSTTGSIDVHARGDVTIAAMNATQGAARASGANVRVNDVVGDVGSFDAADTLRIGAAHMGRRLDLAGRDVAARVFQTRPVDPFVMNLTGHAQGVAESASMTVMSSNPIKFGVMQGRQIDLKTTSSHVSIDQAYVPGRFQMETPMARLVAENTSFEPLKGFNIHLHEQDHRFWMELADKHVHTDAYVLRYSPGYTVSVPNFSEGHVENGPIVRSESALGFAERLGRTQQDRVIATSNAGENSQLSEPFYGFRSMQGPAQAFGSPVPALLPLDVPAVNFQGFFSIEEDGHLKRPTPPESDWLISQFADTELWVGEGKTGQ